MRNKILTLLSVGTLLLSSCWKDEDAYHLPPSGGAIQQELSLGADYDKIVYFNVDKRTFMVRYLADWDLGFEASANGLHVITNTGKGLLVHETNLTDINASYVVNIPGLEWRFDVPSGNKDSTAVGQWWSGADGTSKNIVYVVDMTVNYKQGERYKKIQIEKADETGFWVKTCDLNGSNVTSYFIPKDTTRNFSYLDITTGKIQVDMEPAKDDWDLVFTRYSHIFYDQGPDPLPYLVTGVLLNSNGVQAYEERIRSFDDIDIEYATNIKFTNNANTIGYDWKYYNQTSGRYTVDNSRTYIIKTISGYYYKLRFIDYYDSNGVKGTPVFDMQRL